VVRSDYAAVFVVGSSGHQNALVIGDFKQFVVAQRIGLQAEPVQTRFDQATGRPTGQRGFPAYARALAAMSPSRTRCGWRTRPGVLRRCFAASVVPVSADVVGSGSAA
jgi:hypothetical protein